MSKRTRVIVVCDQKVLVVMPWLNNGKWDLPGGGLDKNEDPIDAAQRELQEELGVKIQRKSARVVRTEMFSAGPIRYVAHYVAVELDTRPSHFVLQRHEIVEAKWVDADQLRALPMISGAMNQHALAILRK